MLKSLVTLVISAVLMPVAYADALTQFKAFQSAVNSGGGRFEQVVVAPSGKIKQRGEGSYAFEKPGKFRWDVLKPFPQLVLADGEFLYTYDPDLEQATQRPIEAAMGQSPAALLFGKANIETLFTVKEEPAVGEIEWLAAYPQSQDSLFDKIRLGMRNELPVAIEVTDSLGQITSITLTDWNPELKDAEQSFRFEVPSGVDVIRSSM